MENARQKWLDAKATRERAEKEKDAAADALSALPDRSPLRPAAEEVAVDKHAKWVRACELEIKARQDSAAAGDV